MKTLKKIKTTIAPNKSLVIKGLVITGMIVILLYTGRQEVFSQIKPQSIRVSLIKEATSLPDFKWPQGPIHPGISLGADFWQKSGRHWQQSAGADLTFYHHRLSENAFMLDAVYTIGYQFGFGLQVKFLAGLGYKLSFLPGEVYKLENGEYRKSTDLGYSQINSKLGFGLEFPLNDKFSLTADYKFMVAVPYSESLPFAAHNLLGLGVKINLNALSGKNK